MLLRGIRNRCQDVERLQVRHSNAPRSAALSLEYEANRDNPIDDLKACLAVVKEAIARLA